MGKCVKCGKRIEYNRYEIIKGEVYCLKCAEKQRTVKVEFVTTAIEETIKNAKQFQDTIDKAVTKAITPTKKPRKKRKYKKRD